MKELKLYLENSNYTALSRQLGINVNTVRGKVAQQLYILYRHFKLEYRHEDFLTAKANKEKIRDLLNRYENPEAITQPSINLDDRRLLLSLTVGEFKQLMQEIMNPNQ